MFVYQKTFGSPCTKVTPDIFNELLDSSVVGSAIQDARYYQSCIDSLGDNESEAAQKQKKEWEQKKQNAKKRLPGIVFQATFERTQSKRGYWGEWRKNSSCVLNGLFILDVDHLTHDAITKLTKDSKNLWGSVILLMFVTASGHGVKIVGKANPKYGNIEANQRELAKVLKTEFDSACKDPARLSFCPSRNDIIYLNNEIFTYENQEFERLYGPGYRDGSLSRACLFPDDGVLSGGVSATAADSVASQTSLSDSADGAGDTSHHDLPLEQVGRDVRAEGDAALPENHQEKKTNDEFCGVSYATIVEKYTEVKGRPQVGARHQWLLKMAKDIRYICDFKEEQVFKVLMLSAVAKEVAAERGEEEIKNIAQAACSYRFYSGFPKEIKEACRICGIDLEQSKREGEADTTTSIDYEYWWNRLKPLMQEGDAYTDAVASIADRNKLGGILAAGAMYGTYLTRCAFPFYDGKNYRFSYIVYIIGHAASGKSFIIDMDKEMMSAMKRQDEGYRQLEREYKEQKERMSTSAKDAKDKAPLRPHYPIRYVPSTISNAKLYARLQDAVDLQDETKHLHLFTLESELATALRVQVGSWAGKLDLELKSFQNEYAGVDYANELSANGLIQVNWNQVISGTMDALRRKMRGGSITDGYVTRMALWIMPNTDYQMIEKRYTSVEVDSPEESARKQRIKQRVVALDSLRCVFKDVQRLSDHCYDWCAGQCQIARMEEDVCVEYFRKRIPLYMMRYTLPRVICRQLDKFEDGYLKEGEHLEVTDDDLKFASVIGDYLMFISIYQWGQQYVEFTNEESLNAKPRARKSKFADRFATLSKVFSFEDVKAFYKSENGARNAISSLVKINAVRKLSPNKWEKLVANIDDVVLPR